MAPPVQAIVVAASSMILIVSCSAQLAEPPSPSTTAVASAPLELSSSSVLYSMQFRIGSTAVSGVIGTGSDLIWTNNSQLFDSPVSCPFDAGEEMGMTCCDGLSMFKREYGGGASHVRGVMGEAKLTFELDKSSYTTPALNIGSAIVFGCHSKDNGANEPCKVYARGGIVGLGRGKLSLVNQLGLHSFSYCLPDHSSASSQKAKGQIKFNDAAAPLKGTQRTKLVTINKYPASSRYYVKLEKIVIGATKREVKIPNGCLKMESNSGNPPGMIIDSGTAFTRLPMEAFNAVKEYVDLVMGKRKTGAEPIDQAPGEKDYNCYPGKDHPDGMGSIFLQFCDQARMEIPAENYLKQESDERFCLAIMPQAGGEDETSILGVYQQRGMHMLFDIQHNTLSFAKHSTCGESKEENHATT